ncbi:hypothetical protein [Streptomyces sp. NPDC047315]|uniref:hypothetical protein n=1 Tax=Streptomyces sp. NPDC047315 TaxID=3155142 RepID=UPI0033DE8BC3
MRKKRVLAGAVVAVVVVGGGVYYVAGGPPFGEDATVSADQLCEEVGTPEVAAELLNKTLPFSDSYSVDSNKTVPRVEDDDGYTTSCFVNGDDNKLLFSTVSEMWGNESVETWRETAGVSREFPKDQSRDFGPEGRGRVSLKSGGILMPCVPKEQSPQGQRNLDVSVRFPQGTRIENDDASRDAVKDVLIAVAKQSHKDAKCDLPLDLS